MAVNTVTKALKKFYKSATGGEAKGNSPTNIINELADNWSGGGGGSGGSGLDAVITFSVDSPSQSSTFTVAQGNFDDVFAKVADGKPVNMAIAQITISGSSYMLSQSFSLSCGCENTEASSPKLILHNTTVCGSGWHLEWTSSGITGALT